jgi:hypothetical protein
MIVKPTNVIPRAILTKADRRTNTINKKIPRPVLNYQAGNLNHGPSMEIEHSRDVCRHSHRPPLFILLT